MMVGWVTSTGEFRISSGGCFRLVKATMLPSFHTYVPHSCSHYPHRCIYPAPGDISALGNKPIETLNLSGCKKLTGLKYTGRLKCPPPPPRPIYIPIYIHTHSLTSISNNALSLKVH